MSPQSPPKPPPPKPPPPAPLKPSPSNGTAKAPLAATTISKGKKTAQQIVTIYGPGGVGKSTLATSIGQVGFNPMVVDIGRSTGFIDVHRIEPETWEQLRADLHNQDLWKDYDTVILDDLTKAEEMAARWTMENVLKEKQGGEMVRVNSIEGYGWGKGYTHVFETFLQLLGDLDAHVRAGRMVICIAHDCTAKVPNPAGTDYIRYEPRLQNTDRGNIRARVREWCDHLLYIGYDIFAKNGKAEGSGTRAIYPCEMPTHMAKSRVLDTPIVYERGSAELWKQLFGGNNASM